MNLKKLAESFNYLSGVKDLSIMREDLSEAITIDKKEIDPNSIEIEGVDTSQGPDDGTSEAFVSAAKFKDGQMLNDEQLDMMNDSNDSQIRDLIQRKAEEEYSMEEGTCGHEPGGEVDVNNTDKMTPAGPDLIKIKIQEVIKKELESLGTLNNINEKNLMELKTEVKFLREKNEELIKENQN